LVAWNCYGRVDRKLQRLMDEFAPDVIVIPESEPTPTPATATATASLGSLLSLPIPHAWVGDVAVPDKGLGIFAPSTATHTVRRTSETRPPGLWLAVDVDRPIATRVIGVVTRQHPLGQLGWPSHYISAAMEMLDHMADLIEDGPTIVAGDFNFSGQSSGHSIRAVFDRIRSDYGLRSAYHDFFAVEPGDEAHMTLSWMWRQSAGYHCDLVFVPDRYEVLAVQVGSYEDWTAAGVAARSDHVPVVVDLRVR
jgi:endonuclease/exonuclease/phosphatase family metal-dependent hydrolase